MYLMNITFSLEPQVDINECSGVVKEFFLNELRSKSIISDFRLLELIKTPHGEAENTFTCQLDLEDLNLLQKVEDLYKPRLDHQLFIKYGEKCLNFTTVLRAL